MTSNRIKNPKMLFQKLGNNWYVFSYVNNEMIFAPIPPGIDPYHTKFDLYQIIEDKMNVKKTQRTLKRTEFTA